MWFLWFVLLIATVYTASNLDQLFELLAKILKSMVRKHRERRFQLGYDHALKMLPKTCEDKYYVLGWNSAHRVHLIFHRKDLIKNPVKGEV